jgi:hypothetical protein
MTKRTMADILAAKKARREGVAIIIDQSKTAEIEGVRARLAKLHTFGPDVAETLGGDVTDSTKWTDEADRLKAVLDGFVEDGSMVIFQFQSIGRDAYNALLSECPPTERGKVYGPDFPAMLVAASAVEPTITLDQAIEMFDSPQWSSAEVDRLVLTALTVNQGASSVALGKDWGLTES